MGLLPLVSFGEIVNKFFHHKVCEFSIHPCVSLSVCACGRTYQSKYILVDAYLSLSVYVGFHLIFFFIYLDVELFVRVHLCLCLRVCVQYHFPASHCLLSFPCHCGLIAARVDKAQ